MLILEIAEAVRSLRTTLMNGGIVCRADANTSLPMKRELFLEVIHLLNLSYLGSVLPPNSQPPTSVRTAATYINTSPVNAIAK